MQLFRYIIDQLLSILKGNEEDLESKPLASIWLPAVEAHLKMLFNDYEGLEDFYDVIVAVGYAYFERYAERPAISLWHSDLLTIALYYNLYSYVKVEIGNVDKIDKLGRPYLNYLIPGWINDGPTEKGRHLLRMLLSKGSDANGVFNFGTTWEFVLMSYYVSPAGEQNDDEMFFLFLEFGADPNQQIISPDYECSTLHVVLSDHSGQNSTIEAITLEFLKKDVDVNVKDSKCCWVIQAARKHCPQLVDLLTRYEKATPNFAA
jgi:hypothetical protein